MVAQPKTGLYGCVKQGGERRWAVGPIKDDDAGAVNCSEVSSMQEGVARRPWRKKAREVRSSQIETGQDWERQHGNSNNTPVFVGFGDRRGGV
jgi:hypothetical protein